MTSEPQFVDLDSIPLIADEDWLLEQTNGNGAVPHASGWVSRSLATVSDEPPTPPELALGILYAGKRHVFSGPQESAKTLAAYVCALEVVRSGLGVVLVDLEMGEWDAKRRFRELGASEEELELLAYVEPQQPATPAAIAALIATEPGLVIVDAAAGAFQIEGLDDNSRRDVEVWASKWVNPFWRAKIATLVLDHVTKNAETRGNYAIGSERKVGGVDVHIGFTALSELRRGGSGRYKITTHKDRGGFLHRGKLGELALHSDPETHGLTWTLEPYVEADDSHPWRPTVKMEQASRWLERLGEDEVPISHVENGVGGNREALREAIQILLDEGYFRESRGARKARLISLVRGYREEYDSHLSPPLPTSPESADTSHLSPAPIRGRVQERSNAPGEVSSPPGEVEAKFPF